MPSITILNHTQNMTPRKSGEIKYIILHYTASTSSGSGAARNCVTTLDSRGYSTDFVVDDFEILQFADDPKRWASKACQPWNSSGTIAGKNATNNNSVSIEMSSTLVGGKKSDWEANNPNFKFTNEVLENTAYLCRMLISKYNIPQSNIIRHFDIMGKSCPGIIGWNTGEGSTNDILFHSFVESLYKNLDPALAQADYKYDNYKPLKPQGVSYVNDNGETINIPNVPNKVSMLASAKKANDNVLKQDDSMKAEFESLRNAMATNSPQMGREILITSELYDSNILKGKPETKKERL